MLKLDKMTDKKSEMLYTRVEPRCNRALKNFANDYGLTKSTIIRLAIQEFLMKHSA